MSHFRTDRALSDAFDARCQTDVSATVMLVLATEHSIDVGDIAAPCLTMMASVPPHNRTNFALENAAAIARERRAIALVRNGAHIRRTHAADVSARAIDRTIRLRRDPRRGARARASREASGRLACDRRGRSRREVRRPHTRHRARSTRARAEAPQSLKERRIPCPEQSSTTSRPRSDDRRARRRLRPASERFALQLLYGVVSAPDGSVATFSGSTFTPDVIGLYSLTVTAGTDVLTVPLYVFAAACATTLTKPVNPADPNRTPAQIRDILRRVAAQNPPAALDAFNAAPTVFPFSHIENYGG